LNIYKEIIQNKTLCCDANDFSFIRFNERQEIKKNWKKNIERFLPKSYVRSKNERKEESELTLNILFFFFSFSFKTIESEIIAPNSVCLAYLFLEKSKENKKLIKVTQNSENSLRT
jgi:hypothetical protein